MADDGMLINFDLGDGALQSRPTFRGGSWKDKLTAKKAALYNRAKAERQVNGNGGEASANVKPGPRENPELHESRPLKKQKVHDEVDHDITYGKTVSRQNDHNGPHRVSAQVSGNTRHGQARHNQSGSTMDGAMPRKREHLLAGRGQPRQVVSSLFSFNPESTANGTSKGIDVADDLTPMEPSNAPLNSELDTFTSLGLSARLAEHLLHKMEIKAPTAIQREAITQLVSEDTDAFIQAETGSGKTLAYLLPIVQRIAALSRSEVQRINRDSGLFAIILAPTRELSKQISVVLESLLRCLHWIVSGTVIGGESKKSEKARLRKGFNILIATPGRLVDHLDNTKVLDVSNVRWLVLDEGDRLMELGFEMELQRIVSTLNLRKSKTITVPGLPSQRTTVLCSATMKMNVQKLGEISLKDAVHIRAAASESSESGTKNTDDRFSAPAQLKQSYAIVPAKLRLVALQALLKRSFIRRGSVMKTIVFMTCADSVDFYFEVFARPKPDESTNASSNAGVEPSDKPNNSSRTGALSEQLSSKDCPVQVYRLHGSLPQTVRTSTLSAYTHCKDPAILICTDVASRGLDLPNLDFVIEFDPPFNKDDHLHRVGRTARAGKDGRAMIFLMPGSEEGYVDILKAERRDGRGEAIRHDSTDILKKGFGSAGLGAGKDWEERATEWQLDVERWALENPQYLEQARRAYQSHIRAYSTHVAAERHMFDMTALHLGHLAKAFALRDKPGSIRVPGLRPNKGSTLRSQAERRARAGDSSRNGVRSGPGADEAGAVDTPDAVKRMREKIKAASKGGASEFNLG